MEIANLSANKLRDVIKQIERRDALLEEIKKIEEKLSDFMGGTTSKPSTQTKRKSTRRRKSTGSRRVKAASKAVSESKSDIAKPKAARTIRSAGSGRTKKTLKKGRRGALKSKILAELKSAGASGIAVRDLAAKLKAKPQNIHVWFSSTGRNVPGLIRIAEGRYRLS